jgi:hypothetical protein
MHLGPVSLILFENRVFAEVAEVILDQSGPFSKKREIGIQANRENAV